MRICAVLQWNRTEQNRKGMEQGRTKQERTEYNTRSDIASDGSDLNVKMD